MLPGSRSDYRTTTGTFKWIVLIAVLGSLALVWVFRKAVQDADQIYKDAGYSEDSLFISTNRTE